MDPRIQGKRQTVSVCSGHLNFTLAVNVQSLMNSSNLHQATLWEGGFREPGIVWMPGKIKAGSSSAAIVATYDIFPTVLRLAGVQLPDVTLDGIDLSNVLFSSEPDTISVHECIMFYKTPAPEHGAAGAAQLNSLAAVRCGDYKTYWLIDGGSDTPLPPGIQTGVRTLDTPVIFDVSKDWSESSPVEPGSAEWKKAKARADAARLAHLETLSPVTNQMARGADGSYAICADPNSQTKHPGLPNCTLTPENWSPPVCLVGGSRGDCIGQPKCAAGCKFINCTDGKNGSLHWEIMGDTNGVSGMLPRGPFTDGPGVKYLGNYSSLNGCWAACNASSAAAEVGSLAEACREFVYKPFRPGKWGELTDCYQVMSSAQDQFVPQLGVTSGFLGFSG